MEKNHYIPVLLEEMNFRLGKGKFKSLRTILESGDSSSIVLVVSRTSTIFTQIWYQYSGQLIIASRWGIYWN